MSQAIASGSAPPWLRMQLMAGIDAAQACIRLGCCTENQLGPQAAFTIGAAGALVFGPGRDMLEEICSEQPDEAVAACSPQLAAVFWLVGCLLHPTAQPKAAAAFAGSTAKPAALMGWLHAMCNALLARDDAGEPGEPLLSACSHAAVTLAQAPAWFACAAVTRNASATPLSPPPSPIAAGTPAGTVAGILSQFVAVLHVLLTAEPYARHREWLAGDPALQQAVADLLLSHSFATLRELAAVAHDDEGATVHALQIMRLLPDILWHPSLAAAVKRHWQAPYGAAAFQDAAGIVEALPLHRPASMSAAHFVQLHDLAVELLRVCSQGIFEADGGRWRQMEADGGSSTSTSSTSSSGGCSSSASRNNSSGGRAGSEGCSSGSNGYRQQAAWQLVALVPRLAAIVRALAEVPTASPGVLQGACSNVAAALCLLVVLYKQSPSAAQLASWAAAAAAGVRLQPLLLQLDERFQRVQQRPAAGGSEAAGAQRLSRVLLAWLWRSKPAFGQPPASTSTEEWEQLAASLAELHSAGCRLVHFMVSRGSPALAGRLSDDPADDWSEHSVALTLIHCEMYDAHAQLG